MEVLGSNPGGGRGVVKSVALSIESLDVKIKGMGEPSVINDLQVRGIGTY